MEEKQLPFQFEDKQVVQELLEQVSLVIKDSDALTEKEMVKTFLQKVSNTFSLVTIGSAQCGKTSFLDALFQGKLVNGQNLTSTIGIHEIRHGAEPITFQVDRNHTRSFLTEDSFEGLAVIDTQGINMLSDEYTLSKLRDFITKSDVLLAIFSADSVGSFEVWDYLEEVESRKTVFVMTKCDAIAEELVARNELKLKQYMLDAGIQAPVFKVSALAEKAGRVEESGFYELRKYIREQVIGINPVLTKQQENLKELKMMLADLSDSFALRKKQYEADAVILQKINAAMDSFVEENKEIVEELKSNLSISINKSIDEYQEEIIKRLDPYKIKELHQAGRADFSNYLAFINDNYRERMTKSVNQMTQQSVCSYLSELEKVFQEATGYFHKRESLMKLDDRFYGTMAEGKRTALDTAERKLVVTQNYYTSLFDASEELFMKIWSAREEYDRKLEVASVLGGGAGVVAGGVTAFGVANAAAGIVTAATAGTNAAAAAGIAAGAGTILWPIVGAVVGAIVISKIAKKFAQAGAGADLDRAAREAIEEFKVEISKTRSEMLTQILETIDAIFERELALADKAFAEYRISVNIDSRNIPVLEQRMESVQALLLKLEEMEGRLLE